jgi:hypothetical protein
MNIIESIKKLPLELEIKIMKIYWKSYFKDNCINRFNNIMNELKKIKFFLDKHFLMNIDKVYLKQIKIYLIKYNNFFKSLENDRGGYLFLTKINKKFIYLYDNTYNFLKEESNENFFYLLKFTIIFGMPYMEYQILEKFRLIK